MARSEVDSELRRPVSFGDVHAAVCLMGAVAVDAYAVSFLRGGFAQSAMNDRALLQFYAALTAVFAAFLTTPAVVLWRKPRVLAWGARGVLAVSLGIAIVALVSYQIAEAARP